MNIYLQRENLAQLRTSLLKDPTGDHSKDLVGDVLILAMLPRRQLKLHVHCWSQTAQDEPKETRVASHSLQQLNHFWDEEAF